MATYIIVRKVFATVAVAALPLVAWYVFNGLSTGKAITVAGVLITADLQIQLVLLTAAAVVAVVIKR